MNIEPYKGLRPYEEQDKDNFFGRERDKRILTDKILTHKLTFLFAASGVGKSSLLQAGVMPALKQGNEPLDVVYYRDWVSDPLASFKAAVLQFLRDNRLISASYDIDVSLPLDQWLRHCTAFTTEPLVIILDQFEEFFYYQRYTQNFKAWVEQLAYAIHDETTATVFVIAMREDFALELNAFKAYIPFFLIENFYRLEKLTRDQARDAIVAPVEKAGFCYEAELLETLLRELSQREQLERYGIEAMERFHGELPLLVEPPHLQIVCIQLWEASQQHPERKLTLAVYEQKGRATGLLKYYFDHKIVTFSLKEQRIASAAFNYLVNKHGTKMAYPLRDLAQLLRLNEQTLGEVLEKLDQARILRKQSRQGVVWFELYHDVFAKTVYDWNEQYKRRQLFRKGVINVFIAALGMAVVVAGYDYWDNANHAHWRLSPKRGVSDQIEAYQGQPSGFDWFGQRRYLIESEYVFDQVEPSRLFEMKAVTTTEPSSELVKTAFPTAEMVRAYWQLGEIDNVLNLAEKVLAGNDLRLLEVVVPDLANISSKQISELIFTTLKATGKDYLVKFGWDDQVPLKYKNVQWSQKLSSSYYSFLKKLLKDSNSDVRRSAASALGQLGDGTAIAPLIELLKDSNSDVRSHAAEALGRLGDQIAVAPLIELLKDSDKNVRGSAASARGRLGDRTAIAPLIELLKDSDFNVRIRTESALGQLGDRTTVAPLIELLKDLESYVRSSAARALGELGDGTAVAPLIELLKDSDSDVRSSAASALGQLGDRTAVAPLIELLKDLESYVRSSAARALGELGDRTAVAPLIELLKDSDSDVRSSAARALGELGDGTAVAPLIELLKDSDSDVRMSAARALGELGDRTAVAPLIELLKDSDSDVRSSAAKTLVKLGDRAAVAPLIELLKDSNSGVRMSAAWILDRLLDRLGDRAAVAPLIELLKDSNSDVRSSAAEVLGRLGDRAAVAPLIELLKDSNSDVRSSAAETLVKLGDRAAVAPLIELLKDSNSDVRSSAAEVLGRLGDRTAVAPLIELPKDSKSDVRSRAALSLVLLGEHTIAVDSLIELLKDSNSDVRSRAAEVLGQLGDQVATFPITSLLNDSASDVRKQAIKTLIQLGDQTAISSVADLADLLVISSVVGLPENSLENIEQHQLGEKIDAITALGQAKVAEALPQIRSLLTNSQENLSLRLASLDALGNNATVGMVEDFIQVIQEAPQHFTIKGYHALGNTGSPVAAEFLQQQLITYDTCKANWRARRDQDQLSDFDTLSEQLTKTCENFIESGQVVLKTYLESPLAFAIAKLNTEAGIQLLSHNLANVRKGAALGLGMMGRIELLQQLYQQHQRMTSTKITQVFKRQAFYRAIDNVLIKLELRGTEQEWQQLKAFAQTAQITHPGIKERVEWTIDQLDFNLHRRIKKVQKVTK